MVGSLSGRCRRAQPAPGGRVDGLAGDHRLPARPALGTLTTPGYHACHLGAEVRGPAPLGALLAPRRTLGPGDQRRRRHPARADPPRARSTRRRAPSHSHRRADRPRPARRALPPTRRLLAAPRGPTETEHPHALAKPPPRPAASRPRASHGTGPRRTGCSPEGTFRTAGAATQPTPNGGSQQGRSS
jgi:hypothetical protein